MLLYWFSCLNCFSFGHWELSAGFFVSLTYAHQCVCIYVYVCVLFLYILIFWQYKMLQVQLAYLLPRFIISHFPKKISGSFYWRKVLEIKVWVLGVLIAAGLFLLDSLS